MFLVLVIQVFFFLAVSEIMTGKSAQLAILLGILSIMLLILTMQLLNLQIMLGVSLEFLSIVVCFSFFKLVQLVLSLFIECFDFSKCVLILLLQPTHGFVVLSILVFQLLNLFLFLLDQFLDILSLLLELGFMIFFKLLYFLIMILFQLL